MRIQYLVILLFFFTERIQAQMHWEKVSDDIFNRAIYELHSDSISNRLYIGGNFRFFGNREFNGVAQWDGNGMDSMNCGLGGCTSVSCGGVRKFERLGNSIYADFIEDSIGCMNVHHIAKWNGVTWASLNQQFFQGGHSITLYDLYLMDSVLIIAGGFDSINNLQVQGVVKFNGFQWSSVFSCPLFNYNHLLVHPFGEYHNEIYAQNQLQDTTGNYQIFSKWNGQCWEKIPGAFSNLNSSIEKMIVYKDELYIAGIFNWHTDLASPGNGIAKWDGHNWSDVAGGVTQGNNFYPAEVKDMEIYHGDLYVVGYFDKAGNIPASNIAKWDGHRWCTFDSHFDNTIFSIATYHDSLFIGGGWWNIDSDSISFLAKCLPGLSGDTCGPANLVMDFLSEEIAIYPNPANNSLFVVGQNNDLRRVIVRNALSQEITTAEIKSIKFEISTGNLSPGLYFLEMETTNGKLVRKFVKE